MTFRRSIPPETFVDGNIANFGLKLYGTFASDTEEGYQSESICSTMCLPER